MSLGDNPILLLGVGLLGLGVGLTLGVHGGCLDGLVPPARGAVRARRRRPAAPAGRTVRGVTTAVADQLSLLEAPESPYERWLRHVDECTAGACRKAYEDLTGPRRREYDPEAEVTVACEVGIRLLPLEELVRAIGPQGLDRGGLAVAIARIQHQAARLRARTYENTNVAVAWGGMR